MPARPVTASWRRNHARARLVEREVELGHERQMVGGLTRQAAATGVTVPGAHVAAEKQAVERSHREDGGEGVE